MGLSTDRSEWFTQFVSRHVPCIEPGTTRQCIISGAAALACASRAFAQIPIVSHVGDARMESERWGQKLKV